MTPAQIEALKHPCKTQEQLQELWDKPRHFHFPGGGKFKLALVVLAVVEEPSGFKWTASVRMYNRSKGKFKSYALWTRSDRLTAERILSSELIGAGDAAQEEVFTTSTGTHLNRPLTTEERNLMLRPHLLGSNGHKPAAISTKEEALKLVDKLEDDFIRPTNNLLN
jgi:hypothetical protein